MSSDSKLKVDRQECNLVKVIGTDPWIVPKPMSSNSNTASPLSNPDAKELTHGTNQSLPNQQLLSTHASASLWSQSLLPMAGVASALTALECSSLSQLCVLPTDVARDDTLFPPDQKDEDGEQVDLRSVTSWNAPATELSVIELLEVQIINSIVPFLLVSKLLPIMHPNRKKRLPFVVDSAEQGELC